MASLAEIKDSILHLLFPHICDGCGTDIIHPSTSLCAKCLTALPETGFQRFTGNPIEKKFLGRLLFGHASAQFYFTKESLIQDLMHQLKYKGNRELGLQLGKIMGESLKHSPIADVEAIIPLPLHPSRERKRGYNQATILSEGISEVLGIPVLTDVVKRNQSTQTQTKKGRIERWQNMRGKFVLEGPEKISDKRLLLIDDIITTGATLEACGVELLKGPNCRLNIAALCFANR